MDIDEADERDDSICEEDGMQIDVFGDESTFAQSKPTILNVGANRVSINQAHNIKSQAAIFEFVSPPTPSPKDSPRQSKKLRGPGAGSPQVTPQRIKARKLKTKVFNSAHPSTGRVPSFQHIRKSHATPLGFASPPTPPPKESPYRITKLCSPKAGSRKSLSQKINDRKILCKAAGAPGLKRAENFDWSTIQTVRIVPASPKGILKKPLPPELPAEKTIRLINHVKFAGSVTGSSAVHLMLDFEHSPPPKYTGPQSGMGWENVKSEVVGGKKTSVKRRRSVHEGDRPRRFEKTSAEKFEAEWAARLRAHELIGAEDNEDSDEGSSEL